MVDITNLILTKVKAAVLAVASTAKVEKPSQNNPTSFPYVTVTDFGTSEKSKTLDYRQRRYNYSCQIDIYMNGSTGEITAKKIRDAIAPVLEDVLHMACATSKPTLNVADVTIYRYTMVYSCSVDEETGRIYS